MPFVLNGDPLAFGQDVEIDGFAYSYETLTIMSAGDREALGVTWVEPEPVVPTAEDICRQIDAWRDARINGGFSYMGHTFQSRATDRENIAALGADAADAIRDGAAAGDYLWHPDFPTGFGFITEANITVPMDAFQTKGLRSRGLAFKASQTFHARDLKDAVLAAEVPSSVDWQTGWPE